MSKNKTLVCIPDISGFTQFMSEVDFELSSKIIPSLLNRIIYSNEIGLKISEIEGDAVLFFRKGPLPSFKALVEQCKLFYTEFYHQIDLLIAENSHKFDSQLIPDILGLKIILHYSEDIGSTQIGNHIKLIGEDIIVAHKMLKNSIESNEYLMISDALMQHYDMDKIVDEFDWCVLKAGIDNYDHVGDVKYYYIELSPLQ
jgi:hypothetical protein